MNTGNTVTAATPVMSYLNAAEHHLQQRPSTAVGPCLQAAGQVPPLSPNHGRDNPVRLRRDGESVEDYRCAMGWGAAAPSPTVIAYLIDAVDAVGQGAFDHPDDPSVRAIQPAMAEALRSACDPKCKDLVERSAELLRVWYSHGVEHGVDAMHPALHAPVRQLLRACQWAYAERREAARRVVAERTAA